MIETVVATGSRRGKNVISDRVSCSANLDYSSYNTQQPEQNPGQNRLQHSRTGPSLSCSGRMGRLALRRFVPRLTLLLDLPAETALRPPTR